MTPIHQGTQMPPVRILVSFATGHGSTAGVADAIAAALRDAGAQAEAVRVEDAPDPAGFDAVIVGGPIRYDRWMPAARGYVACHEAALAARPTAYFFTCMSLASPSRKAAKNARAYADRIARAVPAVRPVTVGGFAGAVDLTAFSPVARVLAWTMFRLLGVRPADSRDFAAIRAWARGTLDLIDQDLSRSQKGQP